MLEIFRCKNNTNSKISKRKIHQFQFIGLSSILQIYLERMFKMSNRIHSIFYLLLRTSLKFHQCSFRLDLSLQAFPTEIDNVIMACIFWVIDLRLNRFIKKTRKIKNKEVLKICVIDIFLTIFWVLVSNEI